jgi:hypothetical protein
VTKSPAKPLEYARADDRWMVAVATLAFFAMCAGAIWWLHSINFFYFKATFPLSEFLGFFVCAFIILVNIAMRIPMLLRWVRSKISR